MSVVDDQTGTHARGTGFRISLSERRFLSWLENGHFDMCESMLETQPGFDIDLKHLPNKNPLHWAFTGLRVRSAEFLLRHGADMGIPHPSGVPILFIAFRTPNSRANNVSIRLDIDLRCKELVQLGAKADLDLFDRDAVGNMLLHSAAGQGYEATTLALLDFGLDVNARNNAGQTPLHMAARQGRADVVACLLRSGANPEIRSNANETPARLAKRMNNHGLAAELMAIERSRKALSAMDELIASSQHLKVQPQTDRLSVR